MQSGGAVDISLAACFLQAVAGIMIGGGSGIVVSLVWVLGVSIGVGLSEFDDEALFVDIESEFALEERAESAGETDDCFRIFLLARLRADLDRMGDAVGLTVRFLEDLGERLRDFGGDGVLRAGGAITEDDRERLWKAGRGSVVG